MKYEVNFNGVGWGVGLMGKVFFGKYEDFYLDFYFLNKNWVRRYVIVILVLGGRDKKIFRVYRLVRLFSYFWFSFSKIFFFKKIERIRIRK